LFFRFSNFCSVFVRVFGRPLPIHIKYENLKGTEEIKSRYQKQKRMDVNQFDGNGPDVPVCRFGPGGDYVYDWPAKSAQPPARQPNPLGKVLAAIADVMGTTISPELMIQTQMPVYIPADSTAKQDDADIEGPANNHSINQKESSAGDKSNRTNYAASTAGPTAGSEVQREPMLFGDDCGISRGPKRKPHHRIRAHRSAAKKRPSYSLKGQGTLFEINGPGQSAA
jgi:hypothetical protein